jgi:glycerol-3-phosphate dehydrogenase
VAETLERIPTLQDEGLRGGVVYYDGQFDDARMLINMVQTAAEQGATLINYCRVTGLTKDDEGFVDGVVAHDLEDGGDLHIPAKVVINCTGPFTDSVRRMDNPEASTMIAASTGVHLVLDQSFLSGQSAIMVPHTADGRVLFAIPWHGRTIIGTTDVPVDEPVLEPRPTRDEIDFILENAHDYLDRPPTIDDVLSVFSGVRPLVKAADDANTSKLSRDHTITVAKSGLVTIAGGKWTTYRHMAEDLINHAELLAELDPHPCVTEQLRIHGFHRHADTFGELSHYGSDAPAMKDLFRSDPRYREPLHERLQARAGQVVWAVRHELARTVDDVLARRTRSLLLDARAAIEAAPAVAALMAEELGRDQAWVDAQIADFTDIALGYLVEGAA